MNSFAASINVVKCFSPSGSEELLASSSKSTTPVSTISSPSSRPRMALKGDAFSLDLVDTSFWEEDERRWLEKLESEEFGQEHLLSNFHLPDDSELLRCMIKQIQGLDQTYPGGIEAYILRARRLLEASRMDVNLLDGYTPEVPLGEKVGDVDSEIYQKMEEIGVKSMKSCVFVLVAGGLGERLGYSNIKVGLPSETTTMTTYLESYISYLLAYEQFVKENSDGKEVVELPLAIMTSDDTHEKTETLLKNNNNFGMKEHQIIIIKQEKVPALIDNEARMALVENNPFVIDTKPHGHGDVHTLLNQRGLPQKWAKEGRKWLVFFQDTNGLVFRAVPVVVGVSAKHEFAMNSLTVPRKPGEAVGGICRLRKLDGSTLTINVEYNILDPMLKVAGNGEGDIADSDGNSKFPGNINVLIFSIPRYAEVITATNGILPEFVNPKYKDSSKSSFKTPTRIECMMQDFPRLFDQNDKVGFTEMQRWLCFSPVKNSVADAVAKSTAGFLADSAFTAEADMYNNACRLLEVAAKSKDCDVQIGISHIHTFSGISYPVGPRVVLKPSWAISLQQMKERIKAKSKLKISSNSTLVIEGNVEINGLELDGALILKAFPGSKLVVDNLIVKNRGWEMSPLPADSEISAAPSIIPQHLSIRGYEIKRIETTEEIATDGLKHVGRGTTNIS